MLGGINMYICDSHTHTLFSDARNTVAEMCGAARGRVDEICITDHFEPTLELTGIYQDYDEFEAEKQIREQAERLKDELTVSYGIELGNPHQAPEKTKALLAAHEFDFVIGSIHALRDKDDFCHYDYRGFTDAQLSEMIGAYIDETHEMIELGGFNSLGHFGYPLRYFYNCGREYDVLSHKSGIDKMIELLIKNDVAMEVNTASLHYSLAKVLAYPEIVERYFRAGGRLITLGSDSHATDDIGHALAESQQMLKNIGFTEYTVYRKGQPVQIKL